MYNLDDIKSKLNIVDVAREYLPNLKRAGRNWVTNSPFRKEKTPSFHISEELQIYKDFGGDKSGDVISFISEIEKIEYKEAIKIAAEKAGVKPSIVDKDFSELESARHTLLKVNEYTAKTFHFMLTKHELGLSALNYVRNRGLNDEMITKYQIGYAPDKFGIEKIIKEKLNIQINEAMGLINLSNGIRKDKFNDRLVFPIKNYKGDIVGFSCRVIKPNDERPKYLNSPETVLFKKSNEIFNLYEAKPHIKEKDFVIITEGQMDTIRGAQFGFNNIVAPLGTSITLEQIKSISRYTKNLYLCFNNDEAGYRALIRCYGICQDLQLNISCLLIPEQFKDIDNVVSKEPTLFQQIIETKLNIFEYILETKIKKLDLTLLDHKKQAYAILNPIINITSDQIDKQFFQEKMSKIIGVDFGKLANSTKIEQPQPIQVIPKEEVKISNLIKYFLKLTIKTKTFFTLTPYLPAHIQSLYDHIRENQHSVLSHIFESSNEKFPELSGIMPEIFMDIDLSHKSALIEIEKLNNRLSKLVKKEHREKIISDNVSLTDELEKNILETLI